MAKLTYLTLLAAALMLGACADTHRYPLSNEQCTGADPVLDLEPLDCVPNG